LKGDWLDKLMETHGGGEYKERRQAEMKRQVLYIIVVEVLEMEPE
jgi:hypothetical protein